jgi:hypothetical protein
LSAKASAYTIVLEELFTLPENGPDGQTEPNDAGPAVVTSPGLKLAALGKLAKG